MMKNISFNKNNRVNEENMIKITYVRNIWMQTKYCEENEKND